MVSWVRLNRTVIFYALAAGLLGFSLAALPLGFTLKIFAPVFGGLFIFAAWLSRDDSPPRFAGAMFAGLIVLVGLSVVWPRYLFFYFGGLPGLNPFTLMTMLMAFSVFFYLVSSSYFSSIFASSLKAGGMPFCLVLAFYLWGWICCLFGDEVLFSLVELGRYSVYICTFFIFGLFLSCYKNGADVFVKVIVSAGLFVSVIGLYEAFTQVNPFVRFISLGGDASVGNTLAGIAASKIRDGAYRAQSTFDHPIVFSQFVAAMIPLALYLLSYGDKKIWRLLGLLAVPVGMLAIIKSGSRSGFISLFSALGFVAFLWWLKSLMYGRLSKVLAILALPILLIAAIFAWYFSGELLLGRNSHEISSTNTRLGMLSDGVLALSNSPLVGFGHGLAVFKVGVQGAGGVITIDNYFLNIAVDYGYFGLFLFFLIFATYMWKTVVFAAVTANKDGAFVGACCGAIFALMVVFSGLSIYQNMTLFWMLFTLSLVRINSAQRLLV